jgi:hypothetical protein
MAFPVKTTRTSPQPAQGVMARATRLVPTRCGWKLTFCWRVSPGARVSGAMLNSSLPAPTTRAVTWTGSGEGLLRVSGFSFSAPSSRMPKSSVCSCTVATASTPVPESGAVT